MRHLIVTATALAALAIGPHAVACSGHAKTDDDAAPAATATTAAADLPACCRGKKAAEATTAEATTAEATTAEVTTAEATTVSSAAHADASTPCPHAAMMAAAATTETVAFKGSGQVLCASCDLKMADHCQSMFKANDGDEVYELCTEGVSEQLLKLTRHGELEVTVSGHLKTNATGTQVLCLDGFTVGTI